MGLDLHYEEHFDGFLISTRRDLLSLDEIYAFLQTTYWGDEMDYPKVVRAVENCFPFGLYRDGRQIGFMRVVTDFTKFAYISDFFVIDEFQGQGLGRRLMEAAHNHPELCEVDYWYLRTRDKQGFYQHLGWDYLKKPDTCMERRVKGRRDACNEEPAAQ